MENINANVYNNSVEDLTILGDFHTHTYYSDGKGDIIDNARVAMQKNLKAIAITDHGFNHKLHAVKRELVSELKDKITQAEKETGLKIYLGVEANFISLEGDVDVTERDLEELDILLVGHHRMVKSGFKAQTKLFLPNMLCRNHAYKKLKKRNTQIILKAMDKYPIDILTHLNYQMPVYVEDIAKKAVATGTYIEINSKKEHLSAEDIKAFIKAGAMFIVDTDAHAPERVGSPSLALNVVKKYNIPIDQIANINKLPVFKKFRKDKNKYEQIIVD